ncbi:MAG: hypothetical protein P3W96_006360 [Halomonas sp.]|nr:hypothetical protein [Halomonas sp.]MDM7481625.1 hypothetical protein [Halomonas sp.]
MMPLYPVVALKTASLALLCCFLSACQPAQNTASRAQESPAVEPNAAGAEALLPPMPGAQPSAADVTPPAQLDPAELQRSAKAARSQRSP